MKAIDRENLLEALKGQDNGTGVFSRKQIIETAKDLGLGFPAWLVNGRPDLKVDRGVYNLVTMFGNQAIEPAVTQAPVSNTQPIEVVETKNPAVLVQAKLAVEVENLIPNKAGT